MRLLIICFGIVLVTLAGCTGKDAGKKEPLNLLENEVNEKAKQKIHKMSADLAKFHLVAGWWTNDQILYVEKSEGIYYMKTFDIRSGETDTVFTETDLVVDVFIHPTEEFFLLHTSEGISAATLKVVDYLGIVHNEVTIASSELEVEWNAHNSNLILLTAFDMDWDFDVFLYDREKSELEVVNVSEPFVKWYSENEVMMTKISEHTLDGGQITIYDLESGQEAFSGLEDIVYIDTYDDRLFVVKMIEDHLAEYKILDRDFDVISSWTMKVLSNYSEWFIPEPFWVSNVELLLPMSEEGGQLDELSGRLKLVQLRDGKQEVVLEDVNITSQIVCSENGEMCLTGNSLEQIIDVKHGEISTWLNVEN